MKRVAVLGLILIATMWWVLGDDSPLVVEGQQSILIEAETLEPARTKVFEMGKKEPAEDEISNEPAARIPSKNWSLIYKYAPTPSKMGSLSGQVILTDGQKLDLSKWTVRLQGPGRKWPQDRMKWVDKDLFLASELEPGIYTAMIERVGMPLGYVDGLVVRSGERCLDPRLNPWYPDLYCREMRVQISGSPGKSGNTNVWALGAESQVLGPARWEGEDWILQCAQGTAPDVLVIAPGFRPLRLPWKDGSVKVALDPGFEVELQALKPVNYAEDIQRGWFSLRPETAVHGVAAAQFAVDFSALELAVGKPVTMRLPVAASYELRFDADKSEGPGFMPLYRTVIQRSLIVVESGGMQHFKVLLPDPLKTDSY